MHPYIHMHSLSFQTIKMLFVVVITFGLCWLPWHLFRIVTLIFPEINQ